MPFPPAKSPQPGLEVEKTTQHSAYWIPHAAPYCTLGCDAWGSQRLIRLGSNGAESGEEVTAAALPTQFSLGSYELKSLELALKGHFRSTSSQGQNSGKMIYSVAQWNPGLSLQSIELSFSRKALFTETHCPASSVISGARHTKFMDQTSPSEQGQSSARSQVPLLHMNFPLSTLTHRAPRTDAPASQLELAPVLL